MPFRIKLSKRANETMIFPGQTDADVLPGSGSSMSSGLTLDYRAIQNDPNSLAINRVDDKPKVKVRKAPDFTETGIWLVETPQGIKKMFSDIYNTRWWHEDLDRLTKYHDEGFLGFNKTEAIQRLLEKYPPIEENEAYDIYDTNYSNEHYNNVYNDDVKGRGEFVGSKEDGFAIRKTMALNSTNKTAFPDWPAYSEPQLYTQVSEHMPATPAFDIFNTYFANDEVETLEDIEETIETIDEEVTKKAFIKTAVSYDSNPVIQELIKIPQVKALLDQQLSGFVDKVIVTTPGADVQQTQQQLTQSGQTPVKLEPISGNPYGHMFVSEDPVTHQKKPLDKIIRVDQVTDQYGTLHVILHENAHHRHPDWSEAQVDAEAQRNIDTVKRLLNQKTASKHKKKVMFVKNTLSNLPIVECDLADTYQKQVIGLQNHSSLHHDTGMIFTYASPQSVSFHMGTVKFPIDIIFTDANDKIIKIDRNCMPNASNIYSCANACNVIEVIGSFCAFHDVNVGDRVFNADDEAYDKEAFIKYILELIRDIKLEQQKDLDMQQWNIKIIMTNNPDVRRFIKVNWTPEDYRIKKADIVINPDPILIREAIKLMPLKTLVRHALLHILAGAKKELPEDKEEKLITRYLFSK